MPAVTDGQPFRIAAVAATVAFAIALPVLLIAGNVRVLVTSKQTYDYNWWRNGIELGTRLTRLELDDAGRQFRDYFAGDEEFLDLVVMVGDQQRRPLNQREILHMRDVKELVRRVFAAEWVAGAIVVTVVAGGFAMMRSRFWPLLRRGITYSALGTAGAVAVVGIAAAVDFDTTFTLFHEISFSNDYWKLAYRDFLILMWPQSFWFDAAFAIVALTALELAVVITGARWAQRRYMTT